MKNAATKPVHPKREFKKELAGKLESVLTELKSMLGEEEFEKRLRKAAKVLTHGLHGKDFSKKDKPANPKIKKATAEIKLTPKKVKAVKQVKKTAQ